MQDRVEYLEHVVDDKSFHAAPSKVQALLKAPPPTNVKELCSLLGMINYYRKFIPNLATLLKPLTNLLQSNSKWVWDSDCISAFEKAKQSLTSAPILAHYDPDLPIHLATDASSHGLGAVISHIFPNGDERPIAYASRTLSPAKCNYSQIKKEALGIIYGVHIFHQYLYGRQFILITDHKPLTTILGPKRGVPTLAATRLQRWAIQLSAYTNGIRFRATDKHANADGLSRLPQIDSKGDEVFLIKQIESLPVTSDQLVSATKQDPVLQQVTDYTQHGWPDTIPDELQPFRRKRDELSVLSLLGNSSSYSCTPS